MAAIIIVVLVALGTAPGSPDASVDGVTEWQPWRFVFNDQGVRKGEETYFLLKYDFHIVHGSVFPCHSDGTWTQGFCCVQPFFSPHVSFTVCHLIITL